MQINVFLTEEHSHSYAARRLAMLSCLVKILIKIYFILHTMAEGAPLMKLQLLDKNGMVSFLHFILKKISVFFFARKFPAVLALDIRDY